jgi:hypothetical protein
MDYITKPLTHLNKRYEGTVYIAVATPGHVVGTAKQSINNLIRRPGDSVINWYEHTKGMDAREDAVKDFLAGDHDFIFFLDGDMLLPPSALVRLRAHGFPCISGHYMRRTYNPPIPIWYEDDRREGWEYIWPMMPFRVRPEKGRLYRLGATGFGCWLIHREVLEAVKGMLYGQRVVWEDHMATWPQPLAEIARGVPAKPLRLDYATIGADVRLSFFIRVAGYTIWGDPAVDCGHYIDYPLSLADRNLGPEFDAGFYKATTEEIAAIQRQNTDHVAQIAGGVA